MCIRDSRRTATTPPRRHQALLLVGALMAITGCVSGQQTEMPPREPGVIEDRVDGPNCTTTSPECIEWQDLARKCAANVRERDRGFTGRQYPYCTMAEQLRERASGVQLSTDPGAHDF